MVWCKSIAIPHVVLLSRVVIHDKAVVGSFHEQAECFHNFLPMKIAN